LDKKAKRAFKTLLVNYGYSKKVADELCKWYAFSEKKGVASY
jgi:predicted Ser/Thr protein kinase